MAKKEKQTFITDPITGEKLTEQSEPRVLSEALKRIQLKAKELEPASKWIKETLQPLIDRAYVARDKKFLGFWTLSISAAKFSEELFMEKADEETIAEYEKTKKHLEKYTERLKILTAKPEYKVSGTAYVKFPEL